MTLELGRITRTSTGYTERREHWVGIFPIFAVCILAYCFASFFGLVPWWN